MQKIRVIGADNEATTYRAQGLEPFGAGCVILTGAWITDYTNGRFETEAEARTIILPAPSARGERIEITDAA
jgi:hypothetical protein